MIPLAPMRRRQPSLLVEMRRLRAAIDGPDDSAADLDLEAVLAAARGRHGGGAWTVSDLRGAGIVRGDQARLLGRLLGQLAADRAGRVERIGESRAGVVWMLRW